VYPDLDSCSTAARLSENTSKVGKRVGEENEWLSYYLHCKGLSRVTQTYFYTSILYFLASNFAKATTWQESKATWSKTSSF